MTKTVTSLATTIFTAILLLTGSHDFPEEEIMNFHGWQWAGFFEKFQPGFSEGIKVLPTWQISRRIIMKAITDIGVWQLKFRNLMFVAKTY
jgi:hypothetical protein